jgi:hypothetical protein
MLSVAASVIILLTAILVPQLIGYLRALDERQKGHLQINGQRPPQ